MHIKITRHADKDLNPNFVPIQVELFGKHGTALYSRAMAVDTNSNLAMQNDIDSIAVPVAEKERELAFAAYQVTGTASKIHPYFMISEWIRKVINEYQPDQWVEI